MGKKIHYISNIDVDAKTATCKNCGEVKVVSMGKGKWKCQIAKKALKNKTKFPWRAHKKDACEKCGFVPEHSVQLDVDHIDGNRSNNELHNLMTLCANCHRLKTHLNKDSYNDYGYLGAPYGHLANNN